MCGRYGRRADKQRIADWFRTHNTNVFNDSELAPTYNAAPQSFQPVIRLNSESGEREIVLMKWALVPDWSKTIKLKYSTINATADKLTTSSGFHSGNRVTHNGHNGIENGSGDDGCYESNLGPKPWGPATETRIAVVDPERGIVIGYSILYYGKSDRRMQINEVFKILDGRIRMVDNIGLMEEGITTSGFTK